MMRFKNISGKKKAFKHKGKWHDVNHGECVELDIEVDLNEPGLERKPEHAQNQDISHQPMEEPLQEKKQLRIKANHPKVGPLKSEKELKKMTKDQLNDYAAKNGLEEGVSHRMKKTTIIQKIINYFRNKQ